MGALRMVLGAAAIAMLLACGAARGDGDLRRRESVGRRRAVARGLAVTRSSEAAVNGGVLADTYRAATQGAQEWKPVLTSSLGVGVLLSFAVEMIQANRYGQHEQAHPTSDGLSFQEQRRDRSGAFVVALPALRF